MTYGISGDVYARNKFMTLKNEIMYIHERNYQFPIHDEIFSIYKIHFEAS